MDLQPTEQFFTRMRPSNIQAEQSVLGGLMRNAKSLQQIIGFLQPEHFADPVHGRIYAEQRRRILDGGLGDALTLKTWFETDPGSHEVGGTAYLTQLIVAWVGVGTTEPYARAIHDAWIRRQLIAAGEEVVNNAFDNSCPAMEIIGRAIGIIESSLGIETDSRAFSLDQAMDNAISAAEQAAQRRGPAGLSTGFPSIDNQMGGLEDGTLNVLAGRPGMGKSAMGWQWAIAVARAGIGVLVVSLEMSAIELGRRALAALSGVPVWAMKRGMLSNEQAESVVKARQELAGLPLTIEDGSGLTAAMIDLRARSAHRRHGLGLIMVDHLHIVRPEDADIRLGATWAIGRISGAMKRMAKQHRVPLLLLAQLNRGVEGRDDKRPSLGDLRQAGDIEQDADVVSFVYRPEYYLKADPERLDGETPEKHFTRVQAHQQRRSDLAGKAELIFAKIRDGSPGTVNLLFRGETTSFMEPVSGN
jgi:replicative DNA helicase